MTWSKHSNGYRAPEVVAELEAADPTTDVDVLRKAAEDLRHPMLCNWDSRVSRPLADLFDVHANLLAAEADAGAHFTGAFALGEVLAVARGFMARMED